MAAPGSHLTIYAAGRERYRYAESIYGKTIRRADAPDRAAAARCQQAKGFRGFMVRHRAVGYGLYLSCDCGQFSSESACASHAVVLLVPVHSAQTKNTYVCPGRRASGCCASADRLGCSIGHVELPGMGALCPAFPVAVPTLHGHRLDVPGGL